jgi:predicted MFS family arabinose efflux permease
VSKSCASELPLATPQPRRAHSQQRQRAAMLAIFLSHALLFASWTAHIPAVKAQLALSDAALGKILLCMPVGAVCAMALIARVVPKLGSRRIVTVCLLGYCAAGPLVGLAATAVQLAAAMFAWGAFQGSLDVAMNTQALAVQEAQARQLMPTFHGAWSSGALSGSALGAIAVAAHVALAPQLLVLALPVLAAAAVLGSSMVDDQPTERHHEHRRGASRNRVVLILGAIALATMLCEGAAADWSAVYLHGSTHLPAAVAGLGYTTFALIMGCVRLTGTRLLRRYRSERLLPLLALLASIGMAAALASGSGALGLAGFACLGAGTALVVPTVFSAAGRLPGPSPGVAIATVSALGWVGFVCGPPLIGQLASLTGLRTALALLPTLTLVVAAVLALTPTVTTPRH